MASTVETINSNLVASTAIYFIPLNLIQYINYTDDNDTMT